MSKRFIFPQQQGERKRPKLDVTLSDHNFPISQNIGSNKDANQDNWGDDNDDEILLLASQACEDAYNDQTLTTLPDYSLCMQPASTSTQIQNPPSTSKGFVFKRPNLGAHGVLSTKKKDKLERISLPLPGMVAKANNESVYVSDDLIFNDKICQGQDPDYIYRQLLQLQEENAKLKSENGRLSEKCVTKEGEASILRTQLKNCQMTVDNARIEKIRAQERAQMEWSDKFTNLNNKMRDLQTQLDFKNLEIISVKEKCKMLESNKVKLTQVNFAGNDLRSSQRLNSSLHIQYDTIGKKPKVSSNAVQTESMSHFLKLNTVNRSEMSSLNRILPHIMETTEEQCSVLEYNDKLKKLDVSPNKCRIFNTFHRLPSTPSTRPTSKRKRNLSCIYNELTRIASSNRNIEDYLNILKKFKDVLDDVKCELEMLSQRITTAFQKDMDEKYIEETSNYLDVKQIDLLKASPLYPDEQAILARRFATAVVYTLEQTRHCDLFAGQSDHRDQTLLLTVPAVQVIKEICSLIDDTGCAILYSGFLLSITLLLEYINTRSEDIIPIVRSIILSRPMFFVTSQILHFVRVNIHLAMGSDGQDLDKAFCCREKIGNLKLDYDQGVLLYKRDSCILQVLVKQVECALRSVQQQQVQQQCERAAQAGAALVLLYRAAADRTDSGCDCQVTLLQVMVYGLNICAGLLQSQSSTDTSSSDAKEFNLMGICQSGVQLLYQRSIRDLEFCSRLGQHEGHLIQLCQTLKLLDPQPLYCNMLSEILSTFQPPGEESAPSFHKQPWLKSFQMFSIED